MLNVGDIVSTSSKVQGVIIQLKRISGKEYAIVNFPTGTQTVPLSDLLKHFEDNPIALLENGKVCEFPEDFYFKLQSKVLEFKNKYIPYSCLSNSRLTLQPHQVFVAHKVTQQLYPRFILADEVGLGKTIEAGLIIKELRARGLVNRVLVVAPANLVSQWKWELESKFNEKFTIFDTKRIKILNEDYPGKNPWTLRDSVITSLHYARREEIAEQLAEAKWDVVIFDEAHHLRQQQDYYSGDIRSNLAYDLGQLLSSYTDAFLLLTATPMQLQDYEFYSLVQLIDPALFGSYEKFKTYRQTLIPTINRLYEGLITYEQVDNYTRNQLYQDLLKFLTDYAGENMAFEQSHLENVYFRKAMSEEIAKLHPVSKIMIRNRKKNVGGFAIRQASTIRVKMNKDEEELYNLVTNYVYTGYNAAVAKKDYFTGLMMVNFQKMLTSSTYALGQSLQRRLQRSSGLGLPGKLDYNENEISEASSEEDFDINEIWSDILAVAKGNDKETALINVLINKIRNIKVDTKLQELYKLCDKNLVNGQGKILIFTQFLDTLDYLKRMLQDKFKIVVFHGKMSREEKDQATENFRSHAQIMISTEAGGEGRNFQFCNILVNYDLPWNPMRVEQRIGRLDRFGQKNTVKIYNFTIANTIEDRVYAVLNDRIKIFEETIGGLDPILGDVEENIKNIILKHQDDEVKVFEKNLEEKINEAREMEEKLADFIMDTSSFRRDQTEKVLETYSQEISGEVQELVINFVKRYDPSLIEQIREDIYRLQIPKAFLENYCLRSGKKVGEVYTAVFNPEKGVEFENSTDFIAFGHELVDAILCYCEEELNCPTAFYGVKSPHQLQLSGNYGLLVNFLLTYTGVHTKKEIVPVFVDAAGKPSVGTGKILARLRPIELDKEFSDTILPRLASPFAGIAEECLINYINLQLDDFKTENREKFEVERNRIIKTSDYRIKAEQRKIEKLRDQIERYSLFGTREQKRILPIWKKQIDEHQGAIISWGHYKNDKINELETKKGVSFTYNIFNAAFIELE